MPMTESLPSSGSTAWYPWATEIHNDVHAIRNVARIPARSMLATAAGQWWDSGGLTGQNNGSGHSGLVDRAVLVPVVFPVDFAVDRISVLCFGAVASSELKLIVYGAGTDGWPDALIHETAAMETATTGAKTSTWSYTFLAGVVYWVGARYSHNSINLRGTDKGSSPQLGHLGEAQLNVFNMLQRSSVAFASAAPDPWAFVLGDRLLGSTPISVRFRSA